MRRRRWRLRRWMVRRQGRYRYRRRHGNCRFHRGILIVATFTVTARGGLAYLSAAVTFAASAFQSWRCFWWGCIRRFGRSRWRQRAVRDPTGRRQPERRPPRRQEFVSKVKGLRLPHVTERPQNLHMDIHIDDTTHACIENGKHTFKVK